MEPYVYQPLRQNQIRLLTLNPCSGDICGVLAVVKLSSRWWSRLASFQSSVQFLNVFRVKFDALSYTWGDQNETFPLSIEGKDLRIHGNLHNALLRLRHRGDVYPIWIDAICINQADEDEKMRQIRLMSTIYSSARRVWIWLGEETEHTGPAIEAMPERLRDAKRERNYDPIEQSAFMWPSTELPSYDTHRASADILTRTWFLRLWTFQEAVLARKAMFLCGSHRLEWGRTMDLARLLTVMWYQDDAVSALLNMEYFKAILSSRCSPGRHIITLMRITRHLSCSDPKDRVLAILGLMPRHLSFEPGPSSLAELYTSFTAFTFRVDPTLLVLSESTMNETETSLPSWCPDYRNPKEYVHTLASETGYKAGSKMAYKKARWMPGSTELHLECIMVGTVLDVCSRDCPEILEHASDREAMNGFLEWESECLEIACKALKGTVAEPREDEELESPTVLEAYLRTLCGDRVEGEGYTSQQLADVYREIKRVAQARSEGREDELEDVDYLKQLEAVCVRRKFFSAKPGNLIGIGPHGTREGDEICVVANATVPFVVRRVPTKESFELVGEAYVDGIMYGEMMRGARRRLRPIVLE